jgi:ATP-dependent Lhr-like helicase
MQRKRAHDLLQVAARYPSFPIVLEAYRECLRDVFDLPGLVEIASRVRRREIRLVTVDTQSPSPFSASLLFGYVANYLYDGDTPLAERRAQVLSVDTAELRELVGGAELRGLIDREALTALELKLQGLAFEPGRGVTSPDRLHDLLLRLGELSEGRDRGPARSAGRQRPPWRREPGSTSSCDSRALVVEVARGTLRGDRGRGAACATRSARRCRPTCPPRSSSPGTPLGELVARYARTHGPFHARDVARRLGVSETVVEQALAALARDGRVLQGEFRPGGRGLEWTGADVLSTLRRLSLAAQRREVEPVEPAALARLLVDWHGVGRMPRRGPTPCST